MKRTLSEGLDARRDAGGLLRAWSVFTVKQVDDEQRVIEGIATTPSTDRMGDIVEPEGARFDLPLPLLWQHDSGQPIGEVTWAKPTKEGIPFRAQIAKIPESGTLRDRVDEAWQSIKYGLVKGMSIGFKDIETADIKGTWGYHFLEWEWLELSCVTIPANADASITSIKSADQASRAVSGRRAVSLQNSPGASGKDNPKGPTMSKITQQIAALEAKRSSDVARREEIQTGAIDAKRSKTEPEKEEFDNLSAEIETIDQELVDLKRMEEEALRSAAPVTRAAGDDPAAAARARGGSSVEVRNGTVHVRANVAPGVRLARAAMALIQAKGNRANAAIIARGNQRWMDQTPEVETFLKTAVPAGDSTTSGWASDIAYAQDMASEFVEFLRPMTILGKLGTIRRVPFNIRYGTQTAGSTGNWVGQGSPIPVSKPTVSNGSLGIAKASALVAVDEELARLSSPSAEMLVRDDMAKTLATFLDVQFVDPNVAAVANVSPASITNGVTFTAATGAAAANLRTDLATLLTKIARNELNMADVVFIMPPETALNISLLLTSLGTPIYPDIGVSGGKLLGLPVVTSNSANIPGSPDSGRMIIAAVVPEILLADEGQVAIDVSNEASIEMLDNPTNLSTGGTTATTMVSMFQTHTMAIRATRWINWAKRRTTAVEYIKEAAYAA